MTDMMKMTVTTLDLHAGYEIVGPVCGSCREQSDPDQGFLQALREIRKSAALLQADAVIGLRQTAVPMSDGTGRFHVQLYGTAVRKTAQAQAETAAGAASIAGILPGMAAGAAGMVQPGRQEGDFLMDGSTLVRYIGQSEYVRVPDGVAAANISRGSASPPVFLSSAKMPSRAAYPSLILLSPQVCRKSTRRRFPPAPNFPLSRISSAARRRKQRMQNISAAAGLSGEDRDAASTAAAFSKAASRGSRSAVCAVWKRIIDFFKCPRIWTCEHVHLCVRLIDFYKKIIVYSVILSDNLWYNMSNCRVF